MTVWGVRGLLLAGLVLAVLTGRTVFTEPIWGPVLQGVTVAGAAAVAVAVALRERRRAQRRPLLVMAVALVLWSVGDITNSVWLHLHPDAPPPLGTVDAPWLGAMAAFTAAVVMMVRRRAPGQLRGPTLDMLTVTGALAMAHLLLRYLPKVGDTAETSWTMTALYSLYDLGDLTMAAVLLLLLLSPGRRGPATVMLLGAAGLRLVVAAALPSLDGTGVDLPVVGDPFVACTQFAYVLVAAALAHPRRDDLTAPSAAAPAIHPARLVFLGVALLTGPVIALGRGATSPAERIGLLVASVLVAACVLSRMALAVREQQRAERALVHLASHDGLTGLANRTAFTTALERAMRSRPRSVVCYLDLDGFKPINDAHGHAAGDAMLTHVARRLTAAVREGDLVARLGGDEFAVLSPGDMTPDQAGELAARLMRAAGGPLDFHGRELSVGASVGVAYASGEQPSDLERVLREADHAMYEAKRRGRGTWGFAPSAQPA